MSKDRKLKLPDEFVRNTVAICGNRGETWLDELPQMLLRLSKKWRVKIEPPFPNISYNFVAPATTETGEHAVIKIAIPQEYIEIYSEAAYLKAVDGKGAVDLLSEDRENRVILIERALPGTTLADLYQETPLTAVDIAVGLIQKVRRPAPTDRGDAILLDDWFDNLTRYGEKPFPAEYAVKALRFYERLRTTYGCKHYLHGDFHWENIVRSGEEFVLIDPKGIVGHLGYEIAVFLNNFHWRLDENDDLDELLNTVVTKFAAATGISEREIREWAYSQAILSAWWIFDEMPELYDNEVANADIWNV